MDSLSTPDLLAAAWDFLCKPHPGLPKEAADLIHALAWRLKGSEEWIASRRP